MKRIYLALAEQDLNLQVVIPKRVGWWLNIRHLNGFVIFSSETKQILEAQNYYQNLADEFNNGNKKWLKIVSDETGLTSEYSAWDEIDSMEKQFCRRIDLVKKYIPAHETKAIMYNVL